MVATGGCPFQRRRYEKKLRFRSVPPGVPGVRRCRQRSGGLGAYLLRAARLPGFRRPVDGSGGYQRRWCPGRASGRRQRLRGRALAGDQETNPHGGPWGIYVSLGNGDGTFKPAVFYPAGTDTNTQYIVVGDFNGDGILDAATVGSSGVWLFTGKGGGAFNPGVLTPFQGAGPTNYTLLAAADFRKNGKLDLVVATPTGFAVLLGNGNGTFQPQQDFANPVKPETACGFVVGALTKGGYPGIAANCGSPDYTPLYFGNGAGFSGPTYAYVSQGVYAIADVNGDGIPYLINSWAYIALGEGRGKFGPPVLHPVQVSATGFGPGIVVPAHLRSPSLVDLVVQGAGAVSVLLNQGKGNFEDGMWTPLPSQGYCAASADFNGDGKPDLAVNTGQSVSILLGTGSAKAPFTAGQSLTLSNAGCLLAADLNGDHIPDLVVPQPDAVDAYLNNGNGTFTLKSSTPGSTGTGAVTLADFNRDGKLDFATTGNSLALGNGDGTFQTPVPLTTNPPPYGFTDIGAGELNNDGWPDLVLTSGAELGAAIYILLNDRHGGFTQSSFNPCTKVFTLGCDPAEVHLADVNGDGNLDLVIGQTSPGGVVVYLGDGKGGFTQSQAITDALNAPGAVMVADLNGDGIPDIGLMEAGTLGIFLGNGNGTFAAPYYIGAGENPGNVVAVNLHGQPASAGRPDIVVPDLSGGVMVLVNTSK